ncbi:MAG: hypothetical protein NVS9B8_07190 [Candidatus Limnocylindrales bacterium]
MFTRETGGMMPEILTESFCERCGTRYTFESAAPRTTRRLGQIKVLSKGMRNWVMSDDTSLDEAMAAARNDDERALTTQQLDAFHATFNFCMTCRQYTCGNCWNAAEGRCLSCAPHLGHDILPAPFPDQAPFEPLRLDAATWPNVDLTVAAVANGNGNGHAHDASSGELDGGAAESLDPWQQAGATDLDESPDVDPTARLAFLSGEAPARGQDAEQFLASPDATAAADLPDTRATLIESAPPVIDSPGVDLPADSTSFPIPSTPTEFAVEPSPPDVAHDRPATAQGRSTEALPATLDDRASFAAGRTSEMLKRFRPGQNIDAELAAYEAQIERSTPVVDVVAEVAPADPIAATDSGDLAVANSSTSAAAASVRQPAPTSADPQWPVRPDQADSPAMALLSSRTNRVPSDGLWAASAQEVLARPAAPVAGSASAGVQPCSSCGLSLSATARFCRRCGTRQG